MVNTFVPLKTVNYSIKEWNSLPKSSFVIQNKFLYGSRNVKKNNVPERCLKRNVGRRGGKQEI